MRERALIVFLRLMKVDKRRYLVKWYLIIIETGVMVVETMAGQDIW